METKRFIIPYHHGEVFKLYPIGDEHIGTLHCAEDKVERKYNQIANEAFSFFVQMGDKADFISPSDPRWKFGIIAPWLEHHEDNIFRYQEERYCDLIVPAVDAEIADYGIKKCVGSLWGQHEFTASKYYHTNVQENICEKKLGITNLGFTCIVHFSFKRVNSTETHLFKGAFTHGSGNAQTRGGKIMKLRKVMNQFNVDFVCHAHMHDIIIEPAVNLKTNDDLVVVNHEKWGCVTGSFLRTYTQGVPASYGEMANMDPVPLGCPSITFWPDEARMSIAKE